MSINQVEELKKELEQLKKQFVQQRAELVIAQEKRSGHYKKLEYQIQINKKLQAEIQEVKEALQNKNKEFLKELVLEKYQPSDDLLTNLIEKYNEEILSNKVLKQENEQLAKVIHDLEVKLRSLQNKFNELHKEAQIAQEKRSGHYKKLLQALEHNKALEIQIINLNRSIDKSRNSLTWLLGKATLECKTLSGLLRFPVNIIQANKKFKAYQLNQKSEAENIHINQKTDKNKAGQIVEKNNVELNLAGDISILGWPKPSSDKPITIMSIADTFTTSNLKSVANLITPRPDNWNGLLKRDNPAFLFVESAWNGNQNSWQYRVGSYANPPGKELFAAVSEFKKQKIPTIFWNKEDPVHFDKFKNIAKEFDYIFTSDEGSISAYQEISKAKVFSLPFAADSSINNPIGSQNRLNRVCFAGSYYANRFIERRNDQLMLLESALPYGLDIYDRNAGNTHKDFHFPEIFQDCIRGSLPYEQMSQVYKQYKVFLNVNSVIDSKTMFSRRVFELLASGTPIVSTPSLGIEEFFGQELVWMVKNKAEAQEAIHTLLNDKKEWRKRSLQGIRNVFLNHTFSDRFQYVLKTVEIKNSEFIQPKILCCIEAYKQDEVNDFKFILNSQNTFSKFEIIPFVILRNQNLITDLPHIIGSTISLSQLISAALLENKAIDFVTIFSCDNVYGKNYLLDLYLATLYANANIITKPFKDRYEYGNHYLYSATLFNRKVFEDNIFLKELALPTETYIESKNKVFLIDSANFSKKVGKSIESILKQIEI